MEQVIGKDTGFYSFSTSDDGLCCYSSKKTAVRNATKCGANAVYSPTGVKVWGN